MIVTFSTTMAHICQGCRKDAYRIYQLRHLPTPMDLCPSCFNGFKTTIQEMIAWGEV